MNRVQAPEFKDIETMTVSEKRQQLYLLPQAQIRANSRVNLLPTSESEGAMNRNTYESGSTLVVLGLETNKHIRKQTIVSLRG